MTPFSKILGKKPRVTQEHVDLLKKARDMGCSFSAWVQDQRTSHGRPNMSLFLVQLDKKHLGFEEIDNAMISKSWVGAQVLCRFEIRSLSGVQPEVFQFHSKLVRLEKRDDGSKYLALSWPEGIEQNTQRRFIRVDLQHNTLPRLKVWGIRFKQTPPIIDLKKLGKPLFCFDPATKNGVTVHDISEGGLRVSLVLGESKDHMLYIKPQHYLLVLLSLPQREGKKDHKLLVVARIARMQNLQRKQTSLGLEFMFIAGKNPQTGGFVWLKVEGKGISRVKQWVAGSYPEKDS